MSQIRRGFIIKVYSILFVYLVFTAGVCVAPTINSDVQRYLADNQWILIVSSVLSIIPLCFFLCIIKIARRVPINYILLFSFVAFKSIAVAYACAAVGNAELVLIAASMTAGVAFILTIFACITKIDFTICWGAVFVLVGTLILFGVFSVLFKSQVINLIYVSLAIIVVGFYLLVDTQLICGGKSWKLSADDYILGALVLYIDIVFLFLKVLALLAKSR